MGDESWRNQPKRLSADTQHLIVRELGSLMREQGRPFSVVLHGGEPLLLGARRLDSLLGSLRGELGAICGISIQTNGVLVTDAILDVCADHDVSISISLDGPAKIHDRFRVDLRQGPTHAKVVAGITTLKAHAKAERLFSGLLASSIRVRIRRRYTPTSKLSVSRASTSSIATGITPSCRTARPQLDQWSMGNG
jgi:uncharacterized protein